MVVAACGTSSHRNCNRQSSYGIYGPGPQEFHGVRIEVVAAVTSREWSANLDCDEGTTVREIFELAKQLDAFADAPLADAAGFSVWGEQVDLDHVLCAGDRVEILRKLRQAPMDMRREHAKDGETK